jgi:hypothetical protein
MADVVTANIPFLLGLDALRKFGIDVCLSTNQLKCNNQSWNVNTEQKHGHLYIQRSNLVSILYTKAELIKLHRAFFLPPTNKLYNLLRRSKPTEVHEETRKILKDIVRSCLTCQTFASQPFRFSVRMPDEKLVFNDELSMDLLWLDGEPALHVVDTATRFGAAVFLEGQDVEHVWAAFLSCWALVYTGYPKKSRTDAGTIFTSADWKHLHESNGIILQTSGVESHNSIGLGKRMHAPLRRVYNKILMDYPHLHRSLILKLAIKATNDTRGIGGVSPSMLVFGCIPRFPITSSHLPDQAERMKALQIGMIEMNSAVAAERITEALKS